jgi:hypothetical protein
LRIPDTHESVKRPILASMWPWCRGCQHNQRQWFSNRRFLMASREPGQPSHYRVTYGPIDPMAERRFAEGVKADREEAMRAHSNVRHQYFQVTDRAYRAEAGRTTSTMAVWDGTAGCGWPTRGTRARWCVKPYRSRSTLPDIVRP